MKGWKKILVTKTQLSSYTKISQNRLQILKKGYKRQRRKFYIKKCSILQEDITVINIYAPNEKPSKHMKQEMTELKGQINIPT